MDLLPAIDLRSGQVVRLYQGDYDRQTTYNPDPVDQAHRFADAGARWLHLVDLDGARSGKPEHLRTIGQICSSVPLKVEVGGGVRNRATIDALLGVGVERVVVGTAALEQWDWFSDLVHQKKYANHLVLGLDAREGKLAVKGWEELTDHGAVEVAQRVSDWPLAAIVYTDIATDGTLAGPNLAATQELAHATQVPVVASGGVGSLDDLKQLSRLDLAGVIVGRAIYDKAFSVEQAIATLGQSQTG